MALKKSELYSSLWSGCDELRGGMDASQYKDYVLVLLFVKYVSDKYAGVPYAPITIPEGASFAGMVALKGKPDIGDQINKKIIAPLANANKLSDMPDFNEATKLGSGNTKAYAHYSRLSETEIKALVVDDKWLATLDAAIHGEMDRLSQQLTQRVKELAERYETPLPQMASRVAELEARVTHHLKRMGFSSR
jgi:type I restriction-modification system DNA methylase subunit